jgi:hypothetical protein
MTDFDPQTTDAHLLDEAGREKRDQMQRDDDLRWLLSEQRGRRFCWELLQACSVFASNFAADATAFNIEGRRSIGLALFNHILQVQPEALALMKSEEEQS